MLCTLSGYFNVKAFGMFLNSYVMLFPSVGVLVEKRTVECQICILIFSPSPHFNAPGNTNAELSSSSSFLWLPFSISSRVQFAFFSNQKMYSMCFIPLAEILQLKVFKEQVIPLGSSPSANLVMRQQWPSS